MRVGESPTPPLSIAWRGVGGEVIGKFFDEGRILRSPAPFKAASGICWRGCSRASHHGSHLEAAKRATFEPHLNHGPQLLCAANPENGSLTPFLKTLTSTW